MSELMNLFDGRHVQSASASVIGCAAGASGCADAQIGRAKLMPLRKGQIYEVTRDASTSSRSLESVGTCASLGSSHVS